MGTLAFVMDLSFPRLQTRQRYDSSLCQSLALWPFEHIITRLSTGLLPLYCTIKPLFNSLENPKEVRHVHSMDSIVTVSIAIVTGTPLTLRICVSLISPRY